VQEHLTDEIAGYLDANLEPKGVGVVMDARHLCMGMRGVKMPEAITTTAAMRGVFSDHDRTAKAEFMAHIERHKQ
jgi:GTP cyclohydrolase I